MYNSDTFTLEGTPCELARVLRCTVAEFHAALGELQKTNAACHSSRNGVVTLTSRRLERAHKARTGARLRQQRLREKPPCHAVVPSASAYASDPPGNGGAGERGLSNHPPIANVLAHFVDSKNGPEGQPWKVEEIRYVFGTFEADAIEGTWMFGKRPVGDWRAAMETRLSDNRRKRGTAVGGAPRPYELKLAIEAKQSQCANLKQKHCAEAAMGETWNSQRAKSEYFQLKREIKDLNAKIAASA